MSAATPLTEGQSDWFVREVRRCAEIGMPLGCCEEWPECSHVLKWTEARDDPFLRYRDSITETLKFISTHAGSGDYSQVIADMATELLKDLGVE